MNPTPTSERGLYLDLVKRCLLNAVNDPKCAVLAKGVYLFDETNPALLEELLATPPDRENLFALIRDKLSVVIEHGTPDEVARVDLDAIQRLLQRKNIIPSFRLVRRCVSQLYPGKSAG